MISASFQHYRKINSLTGTSIGRRLWFYACGGQRVLKVAGMIYLDISIPFCKKDSLLTVLNKATNNDQKHIKVIFSFSLCLYLKSEAGMHEDIDVYLNKCFIFTPISYFICCIFQNYNFTWFFFFLDIISYLLICNINVGIFEHIIIAALKFLPSNLIMWVSPRPVSFYCFFFFHYM